MTLLDAAAVIGFLTGEPAQSAVSELLRSGGCVVTATGLVEIVDRLARARGTEVGRIANELSQLGLLPPVVLEGRAALAAGTLRARHYRKSRQVSLADCVLAATAAERGEAVATSDGDLLDMCSEESIAVVVLPASDGSVWSRS